MNKRNQIKKIREIIKQIPIRKMTYEDLNKAAWSGIALTNIQRKPSKRLMIVLIARGCRWVKAGGPCAMCDYWIQHDENVSSENIVNQFKNEITKYNFKKEKIEQIDIFNSGSFLNDNEVPEEARIEIIKIISDIKPIKKVLIESRPEYIDKEKIKRLTTTLDKRVLEIGIGLESSDKFVRETCINKGFNLKSFEKAVEIIKKAGATLLVYVLVKPPFLTEKEAIDDAVETIKHAFKLGKNLGIRTKIALEPVLIKSPSLVYYLYKKDLYNHVWLWSIVEILKQVSTLGDIQVGVSPEGMEWHEMPGNCKKCTQRIIDVIVEYNRSQDIDLFNDLDCKCIEKWKKELERKYPSLHRRVEEFLATTEDK